MKVKIKKLHEDAIVPTYGTSGAACFDLYAVDVCNMTMAEAGVLNKFSANFGIEEVGVIYVREEKVFNTGLSFEIPEGYVMLVFSRSGHGFKHNVRLANCVGVIDSDYRGELMVKLTNDSPRSCMPIKNGDRIAQAMIIPISQVSFELVEELSNTERGIKGFGSTGS